MSFDIGSLGITAEPEDIQPSEYVAPTGSFDEPVPAGAYDTVLAAGKIKDDGKSVNIRPGSVRSSKNGKTYLGVEFAVSITTEGKFLNRVVYGRANTMPESLNFKEVKPGREMANSFLDTLMAAGVQPEGASSEAYLEALDQAVEAGVEVRSQVDWSAYCNPKSTEYNGCGKSIRGMAKSFPPRADGSGFDPRVTCPGNHPAGEAPVLLARAEVKRIYPKKA